MAGQLRLGLPAGLPALTSHILRCSAGRRPVVLLDGGSGAGKTRLAGELAERLGGRWSDLQVVSLDDLYPGWYGLAAATRMVHQQVLAAERPGYRRWDWQQDRPAGWIALDPAAPVLVEGCGAICPESLRLATVSIWYRRGATQRRHLALTRDGAGYADWWEVWAGQERAHWARHRPAARAGVIVHDAASAPGASRSEKEQ